MVRRTLAAATLVMLAASLIPASAGAAERSRYIVVLNDDAGDPRSVAREHSRRNGAAVGHVYRHALKGYSASMSDTAAARLANDDRVDYVEPDGVVYKTSHPGPVWGLDRIDERGLPLDGAYVHEFAGAGVDAYIIDSGISPHSDFTGRLAAGVDKVDLGTSAEDCDGHGTHVAGTVGGSTYGVAKLVTLVPVRVLNCSGSGTWSGVIAGVDWVTAQHDVGELSVANMSLGGGASSSVDAAVEASIADGVTYAVAAGNGNNGGKAQDACGYSPARVPTALTVGATNSSDTKASWSNYGTCLDLFAPGVGITSTTMDGKTDTWSGTSMATPHVAGVAALYLNEFGASSPATVASAITGQATPNVVSSAGFGSPNKLLFSLLDLAGTGTTDGGGGGEGDTGGTEPPAGFTLSATAYKVKGQQRVDLTWSGSLAASVDIYRDGRIVAGSTDNDGAHTDAINVKGGGTYTYKVCDAGSSTCSNEVTVVF